MKMYGAQGQTGKQTGQNIPLGVGEFSEALVTELMARFYEQTYRGNTYSTGMQLTAINNATFTTADGLSGTLATAATSTPIIGIWNPPQSGVNAVILQATLAIVETALTATGPGAFVWAAYNNQSAITVASQAVPVNRKTLTAAGSQCKGLSGLALTGLTTVGAFLGASALCGGSVYNISSIATAAGFHTQQASETENIDGSIIVPPGGILALYCATTPVAHSAASGLVWAETAI